MPCTGCRAFTSPLPHVINRRRDCQFGSFDSTQCKCVCMGEGSPGGYCPDPQTGECTALC